MIDALDRLQEGLLLVFLLYAVGLVFVEREQFIAPSVDPWGEDKTLPVLWKIGARDLAAGLLWFGLMFLTLVKDTLVQRVPYTQVGVEVAALFALLLIVSAIRSGARPSNLRACELSRGALADGVREVARKAGGFELAGPSVYVLENSSQALPCAPPTAAVVMPRQLLDSMSRHEIDALAFWQLCRQSHPCHALPRRMLLVSNALVVSLLEWLVAGPVMRCALLLPLVAVQFAVLSRYLPRVRTEADLRAAKLAGDAEVFLSALAGLFRYRGVPIAESAVRQIARRRGISSGRVAEIMAERIAPAETRYPTTGSYFETGLA